MTGRSLAAIALKVWGVVFLVTALVSIPQSVMFLRLPAVGDQPQGAAYVQLMLVILGLGARALTGVLLVLFAERIAAAAIPDTGPLMIAADVPDLTALAFCVAGVFVLVWALADLGVIVVTLAMKPEMYPVMSRPAYVWTERQMEIVRAAAEMVAAAVLILGRRGLAQAWWRIRQR